MRATLKLPLSVRILAAAALGLGGLGFAGTVQNRPREAAPAIEEAFVSPALARTLGARWRQTRRADAEQAYGQALLAAGLSGELLDAVAADGLFARDPAARSLFRAEALLRLFRYDDAAAEASTPALADNPYAALIRVRARAGAGGGLDRDRLALATRGPRGLAREAWLLRAQAALAAADFAAADASLTRAAEAGAPAARIEPFRIERAIRAGDANGAAAALAVRAKRMAATPIGGAALQPDIEGLRLAAMLALRAGDGREAARLADRANLGAPGGPDAPLAALAKWMAGDRAQADAILAARLRAAPGDWVAHDLAAALAFESGAAAKGEAHLAALAVSNRRLAAFRRMRRAAAGRDFDRADEMLASFSGEAPLVGAAAALLGAGAPNPRLPEPAAADHALAALGAASEARSVRREAATLFSLRRTPLDLAAAAAAFARAGLGDEAAALAFDASRAADDFFAPVALRAAVLENKGRAAEALAFLGGFAARNAGHAPARIAQARLLFRLDDPAAAAPAFAAVDPSALFADEPAALDYARAATLAGDPWRRTMLEAAAASLPQDARHGRILEAAGEDEGAAEAYRDALIDDPGSADLARVYRQVLARQGRQAEADALLAAIARRRTGVSEPAPDSGGA